MKNLYYKIGAWLSAPLLLLPSTAFAQSAAKGLKGSQDTLDTVGKSLGSDASKTLPEIIGNLISVFLGVLGIIFVILTVYAGYLYMTAAGDKDKVGKAKTMLAQAIIGLIIIVAAYAISSFVVDAIATATTT